MSTSTLETDHGTIHITDTGLQNNNIHNKNTNNNNNNNNNNPALLLIHGNSSSSQIFKHILSSPTLTQTHRILAFDLPGHGSSSNAPSPQKTYWMRGYADLAVHILQHLGIPSVVVLGWSLGGHVGIEMLPLLSAASPAIHCAGLMLTGTPPALGEEQVGQGFKILDGGLGLAGQMEWSEDEAGLVVRMSAAAGRDGLVEKWMLDAARRTDGRARALMSSRFSGGEGVDQRKVVETSEVLVAVVNGADEPFVDLDYLDGIRWRKLWRGKCVRLHGLQHAPFWEDPAAYEDVLVEFLKDCKRG